MKRTSIAAGLVILPLLATALPFLPGRYDPFATPLSWIGRALGMASLLLVPVGMVWLPCECWSRRDGAGRGRAGFVVATLCVGSIAALVTTLVALMQSGAPLAVAVLAACGLALWRGGSNLLARARSSTRRDIATPLALLLLPSVVAGTQFALAPALTSFAWERTMDGLAPLIADIEQYRRTNGRYPSSLFSEWMDYRPEVVGVRGYQYESAGDTFSLAVEVPTCSIDAREFLHYNPHDRHVMASHDADLLRRTAAELPDYRGYHSARDLPRPHWVVLSFD